MKIPTWNRACHEMVAHENYSALNVFVFNHAPRDKMRERIFLMELEALIAEVRGASDAR